MPPYQPPHLRNRPPVALASSSGYEGAKSVHPDTTSRSPVGPPNPARPPPGRSGPSMRNWCGTVPPQSSRSVLASPAHDMRPSTRSDLHSRPKAVEDDMEFIQSVSRSGGDGAEGDALKNWALQERYRKYIDERLNKHYAAYPGPRDRPPDAARPSAIESLSSIVLLFRKLREGVVASGRIDDFAIEVFESSASTAILARIIPQVISSLSALVPGLYQAVDQHRTADAAPTEDVEVKLSELQLGNSHTRSDRRARFASLLLLFHLCHSASPSAYHSTLNDLTCPTTQTLRSSHPNPTSNAESSTSTPSRPPFLSPNSKSLSLPRKLHSIFSPDRFDPIAFWRLLADPATAGLEGTIMSWASDRFRERAWEVMRKSYLEVDLDWAGACLGLGIEGEGGVEDLVKKKGLRVEGRRIKLR